MSEDIGHRIRAARENRGWSQEFLAAKVGATQSTIDRIESGLTRKSRVLPDIIAELEIATPGLEGRQSYRPPVGAFTKVSYVLPKELVERIEKYKIATGVSSDDEIVRRIIDDFLKKRDDFVDIVNRIMDNFKLLKSVREAAGIILANHPLVTKISFTEYDGVTFNVKDMYYEELKIEILPRGRVDVRKKDGSTFLFAKDYAPSWVNENDMTDDFIKHDYPPF